jgi:hypothetical protein
MSYLTSVLFPFFHLANWTHLSFPPTLAGTGNKPNCCVGCHKGIATGQATWRCMFHRTGFSSIDDATHFKPCASEYHLTCVKLGLPFYTRLKGNGGLSLPPFENLQHFICEACTVRAQLQRELR